MIARALVVRLLIAVAEMLRGVLRVALLNRRAVCSETEPIGIRRSPLSASSP
jgi:hypothetical protein